MKKPIILTSLLLSVAAGLASAAEVQFTKVKPLEKGSGDCGYKVNGILVQAHQVIGIDGKTYPTYVDGRNVRKTEISNQEESNLKFNLAFVVAGKIAKDGSAKGVLSGTVGGQPVSVPAQQVCAEFWD